MKLVPQSIALFQTARKLLEELPAHAILLATEVNLDWKEVRALLPDCPLLISTSDRKLSEKIEEATDLPVLVIDSKPAPTRERLGSALLEAVRTEALPPNADVVVLYNGISADEEPEPIDSLSVVHLGEHLERLTARDLRSLDTQVPLDVLRAVVDLALEIGREGREGHPVGTMFVVGDTRKVLTMARPMNFNPFRGYSHPERDVRKRAVREQIKDLAQLEGAVIIRRDGVAVSACMRIQAPDRAVNVSMGLGTRHAAAASISNVTKALAIAVSQSSGSVRLFQNGEVVLHIEPFARPMTWGPLRMDDSQDGVPTKRSTTSRSSS